MQVDQFVDYVCTRVVPFPVSFAGNDTSPDARLHNGQPRRLGLLWVDSPQHRTKRLFTDLARERIKKCGGNFVAEATFPSAEFLCCSGNDQPAAENMARFQAEGVTTVIWTQGFSPEHSRAAGKLNYLPEWVLAGDRTQEELVFSKYQDPVVWDHALVVTNVPLTGPRRHPDLRSGSPRGGARTAGDRPLDSLPALRRFPSALYRHSGRGAEAQPGQPGEGVPRHTEPAER